MRPATVPIESLMVRVSGLEHPAGSDAASVADLEATAAGSGHPLDPRAANRLRAMVDAHFDFVWRSLRRLGVTPGSVDDAAQRVFWVAVQHLGQIELERERAFLFGVAVRIASDMRRAEGRRREVHSDEMFDVMHPTPGPDELLEQKRARETLDELLDQLPLELRTVVVLVEGEGLKAHEVADILSIPEGTVSSRLRRARAALAESVQRLQKRRESRRGARA